MFPHSFVTSGSVWCLAYKWAIRIEIGSWTKCSVGRKGRKFCFCFLLEPYGNESTINLWQVVKAVLIGKFIALNVYAGKEER